MSAQWALNVCPFHPLRVPDVALARVRHSLARIPTHDQNAAQKSDVSSLPRKWYEHEFPVKWFMQHQIGNVVARVHVHGTCIPPRVPTTRALSGNFKERNECLLYLAKFCSPGLTYFDRNAPATPTRWKAKAYKEEASEKELLSKGDIQIVIELLSRLGGIIKIIDPEMRPLYPKSPVTHELRDRHWLV